MRLDRLNQVNDLVLERKHLQALLEDGVLQVSFTVSGKLGPYYSLNDESIVELARPSIVGEVRARLRRNQAALEQLGVEI